MRAKTPPDWNLLYEVAALQGGFFKTDQAAQAGYSPQLLSHHLKAGRIERIRRGVYRLVHFPHGDNEELIEIWLWSEQQGVFSHQTALALHELSDILPSLVHVTLPIEWKNRRLRVPAGVVLHYGNIPDGKRSWFGPIPATAPARTLVDCTEVSLSPELLLQATLQALRSGLVTHSEIQTVEEALRPFGGVRS